uniref:Uncharacterized protein n=1 Tax=Solanum lycopersicum TaxID=4081 RepID=A0A3Q7EKR1_SOLLC
MRFLTPPNLNTEVPDAMEMIFQSALALGRKGVYHSLWCSLHLIDNSVHAFVAPKVIDGKNTPSPVRELGTGEITQALELIDVCYEQVPWGASGHRGRARVTASRGWGVGDGNRPRGTAPQGSWGAGTGLGAWSLEVLGGGGDGPQSKVPRGWGVGETGEGHDASRSGGRGDVLDARRLEVKGEGRTGLEVWRMGGRGLWARRLEVRGEGFRGTAPRGPGWGVGGGVSGHGASRFEGRGDGPRGTASRGPGVGRGALGHGASRSPEVGGGVSGTAPRGPRG